MYIFILIPASSRSLGADEEIAAIRYRDRAQVAVVR
jgi:hypothetical protein